MKEFGPGYNPESPKKDPPNEGEALTNESRNPYASNGEKYMPEGNNGGPENTSSQPNRNPDNPHPQQGRIPNAQVPMGNLERLWDPIDTPFDNAESVNARRMAGAQMRGPETLGDEAERHAAWQHYWRQQGKNPEKVNVNERATMKMVEDTGEWPPGFGPGMVAPSDRGLPARPLSEEGIEDRKRRLFEELEQLKADRRDSGRAPMREEVEQSYREAIENGHDPFNREPKSENDRKPKNIEELFDDIIKNSDPKWGPGGEHDLWKRDAEGHKIEPNQESFLLWVMDRITFFHTENPDDPAMSVFQKVRLEREFRDITIGDMIENEDLFFSDSDKNLYKEMADQARLILWQFAEFRKDSIEYYQNMGEVENINKLLTNQFYTNKHTKTAFHGRSVLANLTTMAEHFDSKPQTLDQRLKGESPPEPENDTNLGQGLNTAFLIYYNLSDTEKLKDMLSEEEFKILLNPDIARYYIVKSAVKKKFITGDVGTDLKSFESFDLSKLSPEQLEQARRYIESVDPNNKASSGEFLFTGEDVTNEDMAKFINIYNSPTKHTEITSVANDLIKEVIKKRYDLNDTSAQYAQLMAQFMARPMGAGWRNDLDANANDAATKPGKMMAYRRKMFDPTRAGMGGNPYSVYMFKSSLVDFLTAARSETLVTNPDGSIYEDEYGQRHYYSLMEMMEMMHHKGKNERGNNQEIMHIANRLKPTTNSEKEWATNHMSRGLGMYEQIINNQELDWHKFTEVDTTYVPSRLKFNRAAFQKEVQDGLFKQTRYLLSTYGQLDFSLNVRYHDPLKKEWVDKPLALALFGEEILDIPEFKNEKGEIDTLLIQQNKTLLWKQVALARILADITAHRDEYSTDKRYTMAYWMHMLEALEHIPVGLEGNENDHRATHATGHVFSHGQIQWLKDHGDINYTQLLKERATKDFFGGLLEGFNKALHELFKNVKI